MENKEYFDSVADKWDSMRQGFFSSRVRETAIKAADVQPGRVAADLGAGTGFLTEALLKQGLKVVAIDHSPEMIEQIRRKFGETNKLDLRLGEAENLPVPDESVDYVFANMYLHHVESPDRAILEMVRILKPGGVLVITDLDEHDFDFLRTEQHDRWLGFKRDDISAWFVRSGLKEVTVTCVGEDCCANSETDSQRAAVSIFVATGHK